MMPVTLLSIFIVIAALAYPIIRTAINPIKKRRDSSYINRVRWVFGGYVVILLICTFLSAFVPEGGIDTGKKIDLDLLSKQAEDLSVSALKGQIDKDSKFKIKSWNFDYRENHLGISVPDNAPNDFIIVVERKGINDGQLEASYYKTKTAMGDREVTWPLTPPSVELKGSQLQIEQKVTKMNFTQFTNIFPIKQFTGEKMFSHGASFNEGAGILYLRIPKDLKLNHPDNVNLEYVIES